MKKNKTVKRKKGFENCSQLHIVGKLSSIFSSKYDIYNVYNPIFDVIKPFIKADVLAVLLLGTPDDELIIVYDNEIGKNSADKIVKYIYDDVAKKMSLKLDKKKLTIIDHGIILQREAAGRLKSFISIPLLTEGNCKGLLVLASSKEGVFGAETASILNILGNELAVFIENEEMKKNLADAKGRLESMLHSMSEGIIALNVNKEVVLINPSTKVILGLREIKLGRPLWESVSIQPILELYKEVFKPNSGPVLRDVAFEEGGALKTVRFYIAPVSDSLGKPDGWILLLTDVSKEKEVDRMKSEFVSTTSHELRTPLAAIKESVMLIVDGTAGELSPAQKRFLDIAKRNINRLANLINDMLDLSKIESGRMQLKKSKCDIKEIIEKSLEALQILSREANIDLVSEFENELPKVVCDPDRITQVITNLVGNAIKFTPAKGRINVKVRMKGEQFIVISISDTGAGIGKEDMPRLFKRFGQLDGGLMRKTGGTGLGLAICKELVGMHGGEIWVESKTGKGSVFSFTLPI